MKNNRLDLHAKLIDILGSNNVYFQPPEGIRIKYPCIIYERSSIDVNHADDISYARMVQYEIMFITKEPDTNDFIMKMLDAFKYCSYSRHFVSDNLNHEIFILYY